MKTISILILFISLVSSGFAQEELLLLDKFKIRFQGNSLMVSSLDNVVILNRKFNNPSPLTQDLDGDGNKELLITDCSQKDGACFYTIFLYNAIDSFYIVDSIYSGLKQPYIYSSEEINEDILVTGSPDFDSLYTPSLGASFSPIICWQYNGTELAIVNDKLYDIFISENEAIMDYIDVYLKENGKSCASAAKLKQAIASIYANYITADEKTNAEYSLKRYYSCDDLDKFKAVLKGLL